MNVRCLAIRKPCLKLLLLIFFVTTFRQNFLRRHLKEKGILKILAACHSGAPFQPGALRTCVPCLMVNPALDIRPIHRALESVSIASVVYHSYHLGYPCQIRVHQRNADSLKSNFLQLGRSGGRPQRAVHPMRLPVNTVIDTTLVGLREASNPQPSDRWLTVGPTRYQ